MSAERLQKVLASAGVASRRDCEELIASGRVSVNGRVMHELGARVDPAVDVIEVDGKPIQQPNERTYILLHKPVGVVSTADDPQERPTVVELVNHEARLFPVGRLDTDSEGLILLTDDGELTHKLTHPSFEVEKEYRALLNEAPSAEALRQWREGVMLEGERTAPAWVDVQEPGEGGVWVRVVLREGRKRQIREVARLLGYEVLRLIRVREDTLELGDLPAGEWRNLTPEEVGTLQAHTVAVARTTPRAARSSRRDAGDGEQDVVRPDRGERSSRSRVSAEREDVGDRDDRGASRERRDEGSYRERREERSPRDYGSRRDEGSYRGERSGSSRDERGGYRGERSGSSRDDRGGYRGERSGRDFGGNTRRDERGGSSYRDDRGSGFRNERGGRDFGSNTRRDERGGSSYRDDRGSGFRNERGGRDFGSNTRRDERGSSYRDDRGSNTRRDERGGSSYRDDRGSGFRNERGGRDFGSNTRRDERGGSSYRDDRGSGFRNERGGRDFGSNTRRDDRGGYRDDRGSNTRRDERGGRDFGSNTRRDDRGGSSYRDDRGSGFRERRDDRFGERRSSAPRQRDADNSRGQSWQPPAEESRPTSRSESNEGGDQDRRARIAGRGARVARGTFRSRIAGRPAFPMRSRPNQSEGDDEE